MNRKITFVLLLFVIFTLTACGKKENGNAGKSGDVSELTEKKTDSSSTEVQKETEGTTEIATMASSTEKEQDSQEEEEKIHVFSDREPTKYINYNGEKIEIAGSAIAENVFNGRYGVPDRHPKKVYLYPLDAKTRDELSYTVSYEGNKQPLSNIPIGIVFGRGCEMSLGTAILKGSGIYNLSGAALGMNSYDGAAKEQEYHSEFISAFGDEEGEALYRKYLQLDRLYRAELLFAVEDSESVQSVQCLFEVDGDTIHFQEIDINDTYDVVDKDFTYDLTYEFQGQELYIEGNGGRMLLEPCEKQSALDKGSINGVAYGIDSSLDQMIDFTAVLEESDSPNKEVLAIAFFGNYTKGHDLNATLGKDNSFVIECNHRKTSGSDEMIPVKRKGEYIAFGNYGTGVTLIVDHKAYPYTNTYNDVDMLLKAGIVTDATVETAEDVGVNVAHRREEAAEKISSALDESLGVLVDATSGETVMNSNLLFDYDSYELKEDGKAALEAFVERYAPVILELKKGGIIEGIQVTGYTDSNGSYSYNLDLSQKRAESVMNAMLEKSPELADSLIAKGMASDNLILNVNGSVNDEKSRRVSFQLIISTK